jgi:hypothetical protein
MAGLIERFTPMDPQSLDALLINNVRPIPNHLRRRAFKERWTRKELVPEQEWNDRGRAVEEYVKRVLESQTDFIDHVEINKRIDAEGPDLRVYFVEGFPFQSVGVEVKSSTLELGHAKNKVRDEMFAEQAANHSNPIWAMEIIRLEWDTKTPEEKELAIFKRLQSRGIILINGGEKDKEEKTPLDIWNNSFVPQLLLMLETQAELAA